ncbi:MAG: TIGR03067 domain-containing protein [Gemmataceae bacterium]|nr:TIGR03067 domain-containing protein [Gemmataceae bacterium]
MAKSLPPRPHLDHLRRQAKELLSALQSGDAAAAATIREHLPAAKKMTVDKIRAAGFRLADAQSAIARKTGFAGWPALARHVEQLRSLEGTWTFTHLEVDGQAVPGSMTAHSRILIDGDRFRTESPEGVYEGVFNIDVEAEPHAIDIEFVAGPEAGNTNHGIFRLAGDQLEICLDMNGKPRPKKFATSAGTGHACERLARSSASRPADVTGGSPTAGPSSAKTTIDRTAFPYVEGPTLTRLQGDWSAVKVVLDGKELPKMMLTSGLRTATDNHVKVTFGGRVTVDALARVDDRVDLIQIDYLSLSGQSAGQIQLGIFQWIGDEACINMAPPGQPRPTDFTCPAGSGRTLSHWRAKSARGR